MVGKTGKYEVWTMIATQVSRNLQGDRPAITVTLQRGRSLTIREL
ncbi:hypothetical protein [Calothrix sp. 336/3]|nr:hypothetical protein [Calothrix sp. 336/3]